MMNSAQPCAACDAHEWHEFLRLEHLPMQSCVLWTTRTAALQCPKSDLVLSVCEHCGYIANTAFDASASCYDGSYENALQFSSVFRSYAQELASSLIARFGLRDKTILEIGCGDGHFLSLLCECGHNRGIGFDPGHDALKAANLSSRVTVTAASYDHEQHGTNADAFIARQVFEHIASPARFLEGMRAAIGARHDVLLFFEVPNVLATLEQNTVWDLIYEHCSCFTSASLAGLFARAGFDVVDLQETYGGQFLTLAARPSRAHQGTIDAVFTSHARVRSAVAQFARSHRGRIQACEQRLAALAERGRNVVLWGAGARGVSFLNMVKASETIACVADVNPRKTGRFIPGTGQQIVAPDFLREYQPEVVIIMNPNYTGEIQRDLARLGLRCEVLHP